MSDISGRPPVGDWATDFDILDPRYIADPFSIWDDLRSECPIAHTDRYGGAWLPTKYDDVVELARMVPELSSNDPLVMKPPATWNLPAGEYHTVNIPPISSDPPEHTWARRLILPAFSPQAVVGYEKFTREIARELIASFIDSGRVDGAADYAQQIPPRVIAHLLGVDPGMSDDFVLWVRGVLDFGGIDPEAREYARGSISGFFTEQVANRRANPTDDLISKLLTAEIDGQLLSDAHVIGTCQLLLVAGIDTTWSGLGSAIWHLASHPKDLQRLVDEPELLPTAVEEFLRAYSPVKMSRLSRSDIEFKGCPIKDGDKIIMNFPGANRDPEAFDDADKVIIDRVQNRHVAFGVGIHRCAGSNLARMEMTVALEELIKAIPKFTLEDPSKVTWSAGQVRGPRVMPILF